MLAIRHLSYRYPTASAAALDDVSLQAMRGEVLGLLGPNGAGKTTLIAHLSGQLALQQGEITLDQQAFAQARALKPTAIAVAPQEYAFYPSLSVAENLACFAGVAGLKGAQTKARSAHCLAFAQLERYASVQAQRLSGGLKRRLNLAIALLPQPELLLFDEPTVGVDPQSRAFLLESIQQLARDGCAVVYTSHYMEEVQAIADRVVILDHGRVLEQGRLSDLLATSAARLQLAVQGGDPARLLPVLVPFGAAKLQDTGVQLTLHDPEQFAAVIAAVQAAGLVVSQARFGHADLEQHFMRLTHATLRD